MSTPQSATDAREHQANPPGEAPQQRTAAQTEAVVDEVMRRTQDPEFPYDPTARWGEATYREPRSDAEAAARNAYLEAHEPVVAMPPPAMSLLESQLVDAEIDAHHASMARDGTYPAAATRVRELETALQAQQPEQQPEQQPDRDREPPAEQAAPQRQEQSAMTEASSGDFELSDAQRDALTTELFAYWREAEPDTFHCFCGSDADLVDAVNQARQRDARDRNRDRELAALERAERRQREHEEIGS